MRPIRYLIIAACLISLVACQNLPFKKGPAESGKGVEAPEKKALTGKPEEKGKTISLDKKSLYGLLLGEIAIQRGEFEVAYKNYLDVAKKSADPEAAERATHVARLLKDDQAVLKAAAVWDRLEPDALSLHQIATLASARMGREEEAAEHLRDILRIAKTQDTDGFLQVALVLSRLKDKALGLHLMDAIVKEHEQAPEAWYAHAVVAIGAERFPLAESSTRKALELRPAWDRASIMLSRVLQARGNNADARRVLEEALEKDPHDRGLRAAYARLLVEAKDYEEAYRQFKQLLKDDKEDVDARFALGVLALQLEKYDDARRYLKALVETGEKEDEATYYLAQTEEEAGRVDEAVKWYKRVKGENLFEARTRLARIYAKNGEIKRAKELLQQLRDHDPKESVRLYLVEAEILQEIGKPLQAMALFDRALKAHPGDPRLLYGRALLAASLDKVDMAERDLREVLRKNPKDADALNALGYTLADQTDRYEEALVYIKEALALKPDSAAILDSMGWVQYKLGNLKEALRYLERAMGLVPDAEIAAHLGEVLWKMGERKKARKVWDEALEKEPESKPLLKTLERFRNN